VKIGTTHLFVPGPTTVPEVVRRAMNVPMEDHRAPDLPDFVLDLVADLKRVFRLREGRVLLYPGSGSGAWEAAISNCLSRGDRVLHAAAEMALLDAGVALEAGSGVVAAQTSFRQALAADELWPSAGTPLTAVP
jgi:alanine-glyoxylate transaminase / serine-glyoxylate transaminase / serine-pyruvate transaminase